MSDRILDKTGFDVLTLTRRYSVERAWRHTGDPLCGRSMHISRMSLAGGAKDNQNR